MAAIKMHKSLAPTNVSTFVAAYFLVLFVFNKLSRHKHVNASGEK